MIPPRLTCPSVWYKRLLLSRAHVEESYSHGLRRWAGYQRFLLQTDEGRSAEPFRRMLEVMIADAEERADVTDNTIQALGDTDAGVVRRIIQYDSLYFKPRRDRLLKKVSDRRKAKRRGKLSTSGGEPTTDKATDDLKEAWIRLLQERTRFLAESLTEFAALLNEREYRADEDRYEQLFDGCALEAAREELQPLWEDDFNSHLNHLSPSSEEPECMCDVDEDTDAGKPSTLTKSKHKAGPVLSYCTREKDVYEPRIDAHHRKWRTTHVPAPVPRQPAPLNTFSVLPVIKRFGVRWSDMGSSSATTTPKSRLDLVRKYISRGDPQERVGKSARAEDTEVSATESASGETRLGGTDEDDNDANNRDAAQKTSDECHTTDVHRSRASILPDVHVGKRGSATSEGKAEVVPFRHCPKARKLTSEVHLPKLAPAHSSTVHSAMLSPIASRASRFIKSQSKTVPIREPRPFSNRNGRRRQIYKALSPKTKNSFQ